VTTPALRATEYFARSYRRTWRASIVTTFLNPVLYLAAMGVGLGSFVDHSGHAAGGLGHISYLRFVAPALVATTAMQTAATESTFPIMGALKWTRTYLGMLATPLGVGDVLAGHLIWIAARIAASVTIYVGVMAAFGAASSAEVLLAVPAGLLTGLAFALPLAAFAGTQDDDAIFNVVFRFGIIPLFLFSGTFFPLDQLPAGLRYLAYGLPLWHGVDLCRGLALGTAPLGRSLLHVAYLAGLAAAGGCLARISFRRRLRA
jgi:lipooligosaccharide transport system permease protein